jgi:hypothetical protein
MDEDFTFNFTYQKQEVEAKACPIPSKTGFRNYKIAFPNVLNIVEGSLEMSESLYGEWEICKIFSADPIQEEFLRTIAQGFVEHIDTAGSGGWN